MRVLLTGGSGFVGGYIARRFNGEELITLGRSATDDVRCDLAKGVPTLPPCDLVVHAAGKAHSVPYTAKGARAFFEVNATGTSHLLKALDRVRRPASFVFISSVSVYGRQSGVAIDESEPFLAHDPYGESKREAEAMVIDWCGACDVRCAILRLPLVAGANPPGNLGAMIRGIRHGYYFNVAGGKAAKSIVLAADVAAIVPRAAEVGGVYNLTDGNHPTFAQLSSFIARQVGRRTPLNIPYGVAACLAVIGDMLGSRAPITSRSLRTLTSDLTFDDSRARAQLAWHPTAVLDGFRITEP
jgi:nucleoside-diphosphate-sugar epimerase